MMTSRAGFTGFRRFRLGRLAAVGAVVAVVAAGSYAFTASNTVPTSYAGQGEGTVSGYTATSVVWSLDAANPSNIHQVVFTLNPVTASTVTYAGSDNGTTITYSNACTQGTITSGSATETCVFGTEPTASATTKLAVSAAN
jgi:hypothetical protein